MKLRIGRPSPYSVNTHPAFAGYLAREGKTEEEIAALLGVTAKTIFNWKNAHPEFLLALKQSKEEADSVVEQSLYQRAIGIKDAKGDVTACIFWLKNRQPAKWREKQEVEMHLTADAIRLEIQRAIK
jgi:predicted transcriptional regulator